MVTDLHHFLDLPPDTRARRGDWPSTSATSFGQPQQVTPAPRGKARCRADAAQAGGLKPVVLVSHRSMHKHHGLPDA